MCVVDLQTADTPPLQDDLTWATGLHSHLYTRTSGNKVEMEDFWAGALSALKIWLYLIVGLIMIPAMFGFSLGISEIYMNILVKTLEVLSTVQHYVNKCRSDLTLNVSVSSSTVGHPEDTEGKHRGAAAGLVNQQWEEY